MAPRELWFETCHWLRRCGNHIDEEYCKEEIQNHPEYPYLTALVDFLDSGKMNFRAVQAERSHINEFTYPLLAHIREPGLEYLRGISSAKEFRSDPKINNSWSGVVIMPQGDVKWDNAEYREFAKDKHRKKIFAISITGIGLSVWAIVAIITQQLWLSLFGLLSLAGMYLSINLVASELGIQSKGIKQFCGIAGDNGCDKVLFSSYARGWLGMTPSDAACYYFGTQYILFSFSTLLHINLLNGVWAIALLSVAVVLISLYLQKFKLKQWCMLCLAVDAILLIQLPVASHFLMTQEWVSNNLVSYTVPFLLTFITLYLLFSPVKILLKRNRDYHNKLREFKKWKHDPILFIKQWEDGPTFDTSVLQSDLLLGEPTAPLQITVACNPYCNPCAKAHMELEEWLDIYPGIISIRIRFLFNESDPSDQKKIAVAAILGASECISTDQKRRQMLNDWFWLMDLEQWCKRWPVSDMQVVESKLQSHINWIKDAHVSFTPTLFLNGKKIPNRYTRADFKKLIPVLIDQFSNYDELNNSGLSVVHDA